ncbi:MAG: GTPase, partial [Sedimentisphaerales bacterium]
LGQISKKACSEIMDCLSLVEAGLDFSGEDIEFISEEKAVARLAEIKDQLEQLLSASIRYESVIDLPAVGIAGVPNAGKSSLLNKLLGKERSIVSDQRMTTRDVLTGELLLAHCRCVLFDCAGLDPGYWILDTGCSILDELAQQAAVQALRNSSVVVFCVDISKSDWDEDMAAYQAIRISGHLITCYPAIPAVIPVATKADLLTQELLAERLARLDELFGVEFLPVSVKTGAGLNQLVDIIDRKIIEKFDIPRESGLALTARLRTALTSAIENISDAINELKAGNDEVATMMLRAAYQGICDIEQPVHWQIDEQILEKIFSHFCIGK